VVTPRVWKGAESAVKVGRPQGVIVAVPAGSGAQLKTEVVRNEPIVAPVAKGQVLGTLKVRSGEQIVAEVPLVALDAVEQAGVIGRTWDALRLWIR
jgi:D-alanyl-D-alanine carboxypeptidase (penicillin-binding protein 5/6)